MSTNRFIKFTFNLLGFSMHKILISFLHLIRLSNYGTRNILIFILLLFSD